MARCPVKGQTCRNCGKRDNFASVCRSKRESTNPKRMSYIEQQGDIECLLEAGEQAQVGAIPTDTEAVTNEHQNSEGD